MNTNTAELQKTIKPYRDRLLAHPVYGSIRELNGLHTFMQHHIYAVWDFMSLLKALQINLTCTQTPWFPVGSANTRYLINEIVAGEESDVDETGTRLSHYEMYLAAMRQCGADTSGHEHFIATLKATGSIELAFNSAKMPDSVREFVRFTFEVIAGGQPHVQAAVFTFGREDLIPDLFHRIVHDLNNIFPGQLAKFNYYLERHIEVDGGLHGQLALKMMEELCGSDKKKFQEATTAAVTALNMRVRLWDGIVDALGRDF